MIKLKIGQKVVVEDQYGDFLDGKIIKINENGTYDIKTKNKIIYYVARVSIYIPLKK